MFKKVITFSDAIKQWMSRFPLHLALIYFINLSLSLLLSLSLAILHLSPTLYVLSLSLSLFFISLWGYRINVSFHQTKPWGLLKIICINNSATFDGNLCQHAWWMMVTFTRYPSFRQTDRQTISPSVSHSVRVRGRLNAWLLQHWPS